MRDIRVLIIAVLLLLAGCAALQPGAEDLAAIDRIVGEAVSAARAPVPEQKTALGRAQAAFSQERSAANPLRLATLLAGLPAPLRDDARAVELLDPLASAATPGYGRYAALLPMQLAERQRLARELERTRGEATAALREHERSDKERDKREEALRQQV